MTYPDALQALLDEFHEAMVGQTARSGKDFDRAQSHDFAPDGRGQYRADGPQGGRLYLGICLTENHRSYGVISLGPNPD